MPNGAPSALADEIGVGRRKREPVPDCSVRPKRLDPSAAQKIASHQMPYWTERMTLGFLRSSGVGGRVRQAGRRRLRSALAEWRYNRLAAVFNRDDADRLAPR